MSAANIYESREWAQIRNALDYYADQWNCAMRRLENRGT